MLRGTKYGKELFENMSRGFFGRVGKRIEGLAIFLFVVGTLASIAVGAYLLFTVFQKLNGANLLETLLQMFKDGTGKEEIGYPFGLGVLHIVGGPLASWIGSWFIYGYGEFIDSNT